MGTSVVTRSDILDMALKGTDPSWRAGATQYLAFLQSATPDPSDPLATECTYTGYVRPALTKASAWSGTGGSRTNAGTINGGKRTDAGATQTALSVAVVDTVSGAVTQCIFGALASGIPIGQNIRPTCDPGSITVTIPA